MNDSIKKYIKKLSDQTSLTALGLATGLVFFIAMDYYNNAYLRASEVPNLSPFFIAIAPLVTLVLSISIEFAGMSFSKTLVTSIREKNFLTATFAIAALGLYGAFAYTFLTNSILGLFLAALAPVYYLNAEVDQVTKKKTLIEEIELKESLAEKQHRRRLEFGAAKGDYELERLRLENERLALMGATGPVDGPADDEPVPVEAVKKEDLTIEDWQFISSAPRSAIEEKYGKSATTAKRWKRESKERLQ